MHQGHSGQNVRSECITHSLPAEYLALFHSFRCFRITLTIMGYYVKDKFHAAIIFCQMFFRIPKLLVPVHFFISSFQRSRLASPVWLSVYALWDVSVAREINTMIAYTINARIVKKHRMRFRSDKMRGDPSQYQPQSGKTDSCDSSDDFAAFSGAT